MILDLFYDDDDQIFEDDEALFREYLAEEAAKRNAFWSLPGDDIDNDYEDTFYTFND